MLYRPAAGQCVQHRGTRITQTDALGRTSCQDGGRQTPEEIVLWGTPAWEATKTQTQETL